MSNIALKHSVKVPRLYKSAATVLTKVKAGGNVKSVVSKINHPVSGILKRSLKNYNNFCIN